jgi:hypothetical protein
MYKFSRCHIVIFHGFSSHLLNFDKNQPVSDKDRPELATPIFRKTGRISVFPVFTVPSSSLVHFGRIFLIFTDFCRIFQKPTGSVRSGFPCSAEFSNTADT